MIRVFCEVPEIAGFEPLTGPEDMGDPEAVTRSLEQKGIFIKDPEGGYYLPEELTFIMMTIGQADSAFSIVRADKRMSAFFKGDTIVAVFRENDEYRIMWIPFLHLLIGAIAGFMEPFLNEVPGEVEEYAGSDEPAIPEGSVAETLRNRITSEGFAEESAVNFYKGGQLLGGRWISVFSDGKQQKMIDVSEERVICSTPDKKDTVNAISYVIARMHADAIREIMDTEESSL